jgi:hypothetical protein
MVEEGKAADGALTAKGRSERSVTDPLFSAALHHFALLESRQFGRQSHRGVPDFIPTVATGVDMRCCCIWAGLLILTAAGSARASFIVNGSFESTGPGGGGAGAGRFVYVAGQHDTQITGWVLSGTGDVYIHRSPDIGDTIGSTFNFAQLGNQYLDLSGGIGGGTAGLHATLYQDFATVPLQAYDLSFFTGAALAPSATINVRVDGVSSLLDQTLAASAPATNIEWTEERFTFVANSTTTRLSFRDVSGGDDNVSFVDNVAVNLASGVPEPSSAVMALIGVSLAAVRAVTRSRRNTNAMRGST